MAKFLSVDPLTTSYPWYTPYQFAGNKPIAAIDMDGLEEIIVIYSPDATERWANTIDITTDLGIKELIGRARYWQFKYFPNEDHRDMYPNIPFKDGANNVTPVAQRLVFSRGAYETSGTITIQGFNRKQELVTLLTIERHSEIKVNKKWWHGTIIDDRWVPGGSDGANSGWGSRTPRDLKVAIAVVGTICTAGAGIEGGLALGELVSLINSLDDMGALFNHDAKSFSEILAPEDLQPAIAGAKTLAAFLTAGDGMKQVAKLGISERSFSFLSAIADLTSASSSTITTTNTTEDSNQKKDSDDSKTSN